MVQLERKQLLLIILLAGVILFGGGYRLAQMKEQAIMDNQPALEAAGEEKPGEIYVHIAGAVSKPGVYQMPAGSRVIEAVNLAVPTGEADLDSLMLAAPVPDGKTIFVPFKAAANPDGTTGTSASSASGTSRNPGVAAVGANRQGGVSAGGLININTADQKELENLPGIGPALAQRIIQYRDVNGPFKTVDDIKNVSGIGDKKYEGIKDLITE